MLIAKVILFDTRIPEKDFLCYSIPKELIEIATVGKGVIVPLKKRRVLGYIWDILENNSSSELISEIKPIYSVLEKIPILSKSLINLVNWISEYYENSLYKSANFIFPTGIDLKIKRKFRAKEICGGNLSKKQKQVLEYLKEEKSLDELKKYLKRISENFIRNLIKKGVVEENIELDLSEKHPKKESYYEPKNREWSIKRFFSLEFQKIKDNLNRFSYLFFIENRRERWEFYLEIIRYFYEHGKQVLIIFPTLNSLQDFTNFLLERVPIRFYSFHGLLTPAQSYQVFKISYDESPVLITSTGKGIFLPFSNLGVIILDEEENEFYNMREKEPRFDIPKVAIKRAELENIPIILGSSSPSVSSFYNFIKGKFLFYRKISIKPKITVLDMRREKDSILSYYTLRRIKEILGKERQVFFLLNRLGYSTYLQCQDCGYTFYCPYCSTSLVYHAEDLELRCHYCGYKISSVTICPNCGGYSFTYGGLGTEKLESYLRKSFPKLAIQRWDSDQDIKDETLLYKSDMIVGTRLIVPWIPRLPVELLVIVNFDNFLHIPDFSTPEKAFHLIRRILGDFPGEEVIIQTYSPNHYSLKALKSNSYNMFLHEELKLRKSLNYPPFSILHQILLMGDDERELLEKGRDIRERLEKELEDVEILGPAPYFPYILKEKYRYQILIKSFRKEDISKNLKEIVEYDNIFSNYKVIINKDIREII